MSTKHPHDEVIRAYLDGRTVQMVVDDEGTWADLPPFTEHRDQYMPRFYSHTNYRIKPEPRWKWAGLLADGRDYITGFHYHSAEDAAGEAGLTKVIGRIEETRIDG